MPTAYGYCRVSTDGQKESGLGIEAQEKAIGEVYWAQLQPAGFAWGGFVKDEAVSSKLPFGKRKGGCSLSAMVRSGDAVVFNRLDRMFSSITDMLVTLDTWQKDGVRVLSPDLGGNFYDSGSLQSRILLMGLGIGAEVRRNMIVEQHKAGRAAAHRTGRAYGTPMIGYRCRQKDGRQYLYPDEEERRLLKRVIQLADDYKLSDRQIAAQLYKDGYRSRKGARLCPSSAHRYLQVARRIAAWEKKCGPGQYVTPFGVVMNYSFFD